MITPRRAFAWRRFQVARRRPPRVYPITLIMTRFDANGSFIAEVTSSQSSSRNRVFFSATLPHAGLREIRR